VPSSPILCSEALSLCSKRLGLSGHTQMTQLKLPNSFVHRATDPGSSCHTPSTIKRYSYTPGSRYTILCHVSCIMSRLSWWSGCELVFQLLKLPLRCTLLAAGAWKVKVTRRFFIVHPSLSKPLWRWGLPNFTITIRLTVSTVCRTTNNYFVAHPCTTMSSVL
jgi:hypothetical protein